MVEVVFAQHDVDRDGLLSPQEFTAVRAVLPTPSLAALLAFTASLCYTGVRGI